MNLSIWGINLDDRDLILDTTIDAGIDCSVLSTWSMIQSVLSLCTLNAALESCCLKFIRMN